ncbi:MAG: hypothetical protein KDA62_17650, partial [Planctomycetales bacterium]|nr:hypothetical protein [Planctomycetales bacterium]
PENLRRLLENERVKRTLVWERKSRPYGTVVRAVMTADIPAAAIDEWQMEIEQANQRSANRIWLRIAGTLASILISLVSVGIVDGRTRGYRRRSLAFFWAFVVLFATTAIWTVF